METTVLIEKTFSKKQIEVIKATLRGGFWGDCSHEMANGETKEARGYSTDDVKVEGLKKRQVAGIYSGIAKGIYKEKLDFMAHVTNYWGEGNTTDGMLFISTDVADEVEEWAKQ